MKLLLISTDRKLFQKDSAVRARMIEYAKNFDEVHIVVFAQKNSVENHEDVLSNNCWIYSTSSTFKILYPFNAIRLGKFIIVRRGITNIICQDPFMTAMAGISLKKQFNIPLELQLHTDIGSPKYLSTFGNRIRKSLALSYLPKADTVRVVSQRVKKYLVEVLNIDQNKITVRPIEIDLEKIKNAPILPEADLGRKYPQFNKIILMASRFEWEKNIDLAIEAMAKVVKIQPQTGLIIVGDGSLKNKLHDLVSNLGLSKSVIFEPWTKNEKIISYYKTADIFLNTSLFEGYGMTLVEAQTAGCKIISTDVGIANEVGAKIVGHDWREVADAIIADIK